MTTTVVNSAIGFESAEIKSTVTNSKVMVNADVIFSIVGEVVVLSLYSVCSTANNTTASTLQYSATNTATTTSQTISGATTTLASAAIGVAVVAQLSALATAPVISNASGAGIIPTAGMHLSGPTNITTVIGVGSTTGTWKHYVRYSPVTTGSYITAAF